MVGLNHAGGPVNEGEVVEAGKPAACTPVEWVERLMRDLSGKK